MHPIKETRLVSEIKGLNTYVLLFLICSYFLSYSGDRETNPGKINTNFNGGYSPKKVEK